MGENAGSWTQKLRASCHAGVETVVGNFCLQHSTVALISAKELALF